ncbi:MAG: DinB family protein [Anaerolineae bacterium]|nr:DinB family protein [Anaerolineae bacterium]
MTASNETNPGEAQAQRLERVYEQLATLLNQPAVAQRLRIAPGQNEWSAMQVLGHIIEMIPYWLHHCHRMITATAEPPQFGRTLDAPERLAGVEQATTRDPDELLRLLNHEVQAATRIIRHMSPEERSKTGFHLRRGETTVAEVVELFIVAHAEEHLAQIRAALQS